MIYFSLQIKTVEIYENNAVGIGSSFLTLKGRDVDVIDTTAGNFYYHIVSDTGYVLGDTCGDIFCVGKSTGKLYHNRLLVCIFMCIYMCISVIYMQ